MEIVRLRAAGVAKIGIDLIAGLPYQTEGSWKESLGCALASGVTHVSVYMLEVDEESRLGREVLAGGARYGAASVPTDDEAGSLYEVACGCWMPEACISMRSRTSRGRGMPRATI